MINLKLRSAAVIFSILLVSFMSCKTAVDSEDTLAIEFEKYELENGLQVILHQDKSDPIVSLAVQYGVGSNREKTGRTGFAHLFEHMLFQESENVPQDQFFKKIQNVGGTLNGGTWKDGTVYYEIVPNNALETIMWLESDRMGFLINTVTEAAFYNQQEVVQNEKRQRVDNNPYGHTSWVIDKAIYPEGHPYNWQVIGELVDLQNATVEDVKEFYSKYYGPNNATLVLAGDFESVDAKAMIEKYFGEIKRGQEVAKLKPQPVTINETKRLYHEDNFATAPQLNMVWPTLEQYTDDAYALDFLGELLANGKKAPMYKVLVEEKKLTSRTTAYNRSQELAGAFRVSITANDGKNLADVEDAIFEAFQKFETDGVTNKDVERIKASQETDFYNSISSVLGKSYGLAQYNVFAGDPSFITQDIENIKAVTKEDVMRVFNTYIKDMPYVITSFVPKGKIELAAKNSQLAAVVEEEIKDNIDVSIVEANDEVVVKTPSNFDRSVEPNQGETPKLNIPDSWSATLSNGMTVNGMEHNELPLVNFSLVIDGGHLLDSFDKIGVANLMTDILMEGTANKTPQELEEEIELLGATINMFTGRESITISGNTLVRNFDKTMNLVEEILLEPRWDEEELKRIKLSTINGIKRSASNPNVVSRNVYNKLIYGEKHMFAYPTSGTVSSIELITMDDLKAFYNNNFSPSVSRFHIVGNINKDKTLAVLNDLETKWESKDVTIPTYEIKAESDKASLYFVDIPNAKQSVINIGYLGMARTDPDYFASTVMNYKLGGSFSGNVNLILREEKGYTYGARTGFSGSKIKGTFTASSSVRTNTTLESVMIFKEEIEKYKEGISKEDLEFTKNALIKSNARRFETQGALLRILQNISNYNLSKDYIADEEGIIKSMTLEQHKALANKYLDASKMGYLVIGDAETQFEKFKDAGFDEVILLDKDGKVVKLIDIKL
ncbi:MAG: zinc protease [Candidatus Arcticimaribacter sp.]|jgi:zinc protease